MKCNQINLEQNGTLELGGNACYGQICCSVALLRCSTSSSSCSFSQLFIQIILLENAIRGARGRAAAGTVDKFSNGKRRVLFFLNENSFSCLLCATSRRTKDEDDYDDDEKASL